MRRFAKLYNGLALAAGLAFLSPAVAEAQACNWGNRGDNPQAFGLYWGSTYLLNVNEYLNCWTEPPAVTGYTPVIGQTVVLSTFGMYVQRSATDVSPFRLESLRLGSGWTNGIQLTFRGYLGLEDNVPEYQTTRTLNVADGLVDWNFDGREFNYFTIHANYAEGLGRDVDPFQSWRYNFEVNGAYEPYETFFVSGVTLRQPPVAVPEPASATLVLVGAAGLIGAARRRRQAK